MSAVDVIGAFVACMLIAPFIVILWALAWGLVKAIRDAP
jgi:hypothetical protein